MSISIMTRHGSSRRPVRRRGGYSLLEILVVLAIIALIAAVVGPRVFAQLDRSKTRAAELQIRALEAALETMRLDIGRAPSSAEGLQLLVRADPAQVTGWYGPYLDDVVPNDPWGRPYIYLTPEESAAADSSTEIAAAAPSGEARPRVISYGADGQPGGEGANADVSSRAG